MPSELFRSVPLLAPDERLAPSRNPVAVRVQLLEGFAQLPEILDGISDGIVTVDRSWKITYANAAFSRLLPKTRAEVLGQLLWNELPALKDTSFGRAFVQSMTEAVAVTLEDQFAPLRLWLEARSFPTPSGLTILVRDVTARKEAEAKTQRRVLQLRALTDAALALTSADTLEERLLTCAQRARELVGSRRAFISLLVGESWTQARHAEAVAPGSPRSEGVRADTSEALFALVRDSGGPVRLSRLELLRLPVSWGEGEQAPPSDWVGAPLTARDGHCVGVLQLWEKERGEFDLEDEHLLMQLAHVAAVALENARLYDEATAQTRRAEAANRIKDEFLATVSHELRTPLTSILGWTQMLRTRSLEPEKRERGMETIERNARALKQLVEDLLDVSRIIAGKVRIELGEVEPHRVVEAALDSVRPAAQAKGVAIRAQLDAASGPIQGDGARLQQVVWNLLVNAIKFTPPGGKVDVDLGAFGDHVFITVTDTGEGIDPAFLPHLFERFRQADGSTSRMHGGLGLGLSIVRHLVELHGGQVAAMSLGKGKGSTFSVRLPTTVRLDEGAEERRKLAGGRTPEGPRTELSGLRVLVVDDSTDTRELVGAVLNAAGAEVVLAACVDEGLHLLRQWRPHLLVSDLGMPGEDGFKLLERLRLLPAAEGGLTPAIALTAYARAEDREKVLLAGFQRHITKPLDNQDLIAAVAQVAGRRFRGEVG